MSNKDSFPDVDFVPLHEPDAEQDVAPLDDHVKVISFPTKISEEEALKLTVTAVGVGAESETSTTTSTTGDDKKALRITDKVYHRFYDPHLSEIIDAKSLKNL